MESCEIGEIDTNACCELEKQILTDEIDDSEFLNFAIENFSELFGYIASGRVDIRILLVRCGLGWGRMLNKLTL